MIQNFSQNILQPQQDFQGYQQPYNQSQVTQLRQTYQPNPPQQYQTNYPQNIQHQTHYTTQQSNVMYVNQPQMANPNDFKQTVIQRKDAYKDYQNPMIRELYHVEREVQVISVEDVEAPWKRKCIELEVRLYDLETELARYKNLGINQQVYVDESRITELELKIKKLLMAESELHLDIERLNDEIEDWRDRYKKLHSEYQNTQGSNEEARQLRMQLSERDSRISRLDDEILKKNRTNDELLEQLRNKDRELEDLHNHIYQLEQELNETSQTTSQITNLQNEVDIWRKKFRDVNGEYHKVQEDLMLAQAELDSIKNTKVTVTKERVISTSGTQKPQISVTKP